MDTLRGDNYTFLIISPSNPEYKRQLTYKCIVNNKSENIKAPLTLISLKYTQNWLTVHYNRLSPTQQCTQ